jgi:very-short-patch-repair endonuclease/predicted transcriptional regulator of viral defense system
MDAYLVEGTLDQRIAALADRFHGVLDVEQLRGVGASRTQIGKRVRSRRLVPLYRGVYAVGHRQLTNSGRWLAAVRALGDGAVLSHLQAAALWHLQARHGGWIHVTVPKGGRAKRRGLIVHRTLDLPPEHVTVREGIPVTTPARTLADLAGMLDAAALARALEEAEKQKLLDVPSLLAACAGRPGAAQIRKLVESELPHTRSDLEAAFRELCDRYGLPRPVTNAQVHGYEVDAYWPKHGLVVELDSWRHHGTRAAFERDRTRDAELLARGISTARFTYHQVTSRQSWVATRLAPRFQRGSSSSRRFAA